MRRIQQKRTRGWKKPPGAISCARPTKWGNPWLIHPAGFGEFIVVHRHTGEQLVGRLSQERAQYWAVVGYRRHLAEHPELRAQLDQLRGHDLMCYCAVDATCHVDVLLDLLAQSD